MRVVIDTNVLLVSFSPFSTSFWVLQSLMSGRLTLCISTDILLEYQEIFERKLGYETAQAFMDLLLALPSLEQVNNHFFWYLVENDPDDNKFVDCAITAGAKYLVSNDKHFTALKRNPLFEFRILNLEEFKDVLS